MVVMSQLFSYSFQSRCLPAVVAKTPADLMQKNRGCYLLRPVGADQSEPTVVFRRGGLTGTKNILIDGEYRHYRNGKHVKNLIF